MNKIKELLKKMSKEQIKDLLIIIAVVSLFKIAFWGIDTNMKTSRIGGIPVDVSGSITTETIFPIRVEIER